MSATDLTRKDYIATFEFLISARIFYDGLRYSNHFLNYA